jgi:hypothetical protein
MQSQSLPDFNPKEAQCRMVVELWTRLAAEIFRRSYCPVSKASIKKWPVILSEAYFSGAEGPAFGNADKPVSPELMLRTSETGH